MNVVKLLFSIVFLIFGDFTAEYTADNFSIHGRRFQAENMKESKQVLFTQNTYFLTGNKITENMDPNMVIELTAESKKNRSIIIIQRWLVIFLSVFAIWLIYLLRTNLKSKKKIRGLNSDLAQYNKKLEDLNRNKDKYLSIISHDLKAPLGSIKELLQVYIDEDDLPDKEQLKVLYAEVDHINALMEDLLNWSKIQFEKQKIYFEVFKLNDIVNKVLNALLIIVHKKRITLDVSIDPKITVYADRNMVKMVMRNLISNALKFTRSDGLVTVTAVKTEHNKIRIKVTDTGVGIASSRLETIFDPAKVISTPGTENEIGTGLGLVLCKEFVQLNNGSIHIDSVQGKGTTVTVTLNVDQSNI
ncbi:sensor histidine kinase [Saccharicrinis sp. FJH62]|uniref:sensor histidine kinase n=1 Tax=Saccharicrinis sp. FJH62 TaxID=3344657 RepID=UPI0035D4F0F1